MFFSAHPRQHSTIARVMSSNQITDKNDEPINIGDTVSAKSRGGTPTGTVSDIVTSTQEAEEKDVKNPPKVLFEDQHGECCTDLCESHCMKDAESNLGHYVSHNPETLVHGDDPRK